MPQDGKKIIFDRIQATENHFGELCTELSGFTKKKARLRDRYDELSRVFKSYADSVTLNETLASGLSNYSKAFTLIGDVKDLEVQRLQTMIVRELAGYESVCKTNKEILKHSMLIRDKELTRKSQMEMIRQRTQHRNPSAQAEIEQAEHPIEESKSAQELEANILNFERQKLCDIRKILIDFTLIQLKESVKTMEILTAAYGDLINIDIDRDLNEFSQKVLNTSASTLKPANRSQSMSALNTNSDKLKPPNMTSSTLSLDSPKMDQSKANHNGNGVNRDYQSNTTASDDDEDDEKTTETEEESSTEEEDDESNDKHTTENDEGDDNDDVEIRQQRNFARDARDSVAIRKANMSQADRRPAPTPQVRFSKLATQK